MSTSFTKRGRPKGSGIDDTRTLQEILALLDRNPQMKPTTAIRALGIENESIIRRLRDKLRAMTEQSLTPVRFSRQADGTPNTKAQTPPAPHNSATANLAIQREPTIRSHTAAQPGARQLGQTIAARHDTDVTDDRATAPRTAATSGKDGSGTVRHAAPVADPLTQLPMAIFAASFSATQFLAIQNALYFQAGMREAAKIYSRPVKTARCPSCGAGPR